MEADRPIALKYFIDAEYLESLLDLGFIPKVST